MKEQIFVDIQADASGFHEGMNGVVDRLTGAGPAAIAGAAAAAGAAIAGFAAQGVREFSSLEQGMNEVFTLLPGMSQEAMTGMTQDVQDFATEMGVLPDEVVPALYDAISAGVPKENVFEFLRTAHEGAVGGVTDLNTSVDGLTSAMNAYADQGLSAQEASDSMFTTVRLGKTTIDELADSVSRTAPMAASLGVSFQDVNAAIATMTAQGDPTAEASTKIRAALQELGKSGSSASDAFADIAGKTFPEFIEQGGSFQEALVMMADKAEASGTRVSDMFGSVEAAQAAQMLTSDSGRETMVNNLDAMANSAGATQAAYETMDQGISRTWERITTSMSSFLTEIGERFAPGVTGLLNGVLETFNGAKDDILGAIDALSGGFDTNLGEMDGTAGEILSSLQELFGSLREALRSVFEALAALWENVLKPAWVAMSPFIEENINTIVIVLETAMDTITGLFEALAALLEGDFTGAWRAIETMIDEVLDNLGGLVERWWERLRGVFDSLTEYLGGAFTDAINGWRDTITTVFETLRDNIINAMTAAFNSLGSVARAGLEGVKGAWDWLIGVLGTGWETLRNMMSNAATAIADTVRGVFESAVGAIMDLLNGVVDHVNGVIETINSSLEVEMPDVPSITITNPLPGDNDFEVGGVNIPDIDPPDIPSIPQLAKGGIVDAATLAVIGEAGPEAVIPLDRLDGMMNRGSQQIIVELDGRRIAESTVRHAPSVVRLHGA